MRTPSKSILRRKHLSMAHMPKLKHREQNRLRLEIAKDALPVLLRYYSYMFLKLFAEFARLFVSEAFPSCWGQYAALRPWCATEKDKHVLIIRHKRSSCFSKENFCSAFNLCYERLQSIGASVIVCDASDSDSGSSFNLSEVYVPSYPLLEDHSSFSLLLNPHVNRNAFAKLILPPVKKEADVS